MAIIISFYISTGKKNAMYTLRQVRTDDTASSITNHSLMLHNDNYVCNLSSDEDKAVLKAKDHVDAYRERVGESEHLKIIFDENPYAQNYKRKGKLSVKDSQMLDLIENGVFPIGKNKGSLISDSEDSYILYWVDKGNSEDISEVLRSLSVVCLGIALEKGLIKKREIQQEIQHEKDLMSNFIGEVGKRIDVAGVLSSCSENKEYVYGVGYVGTGYFKNKIISNNDIIYYNGKKLGEVNEDLNLRFTVKSHYEKNGVKMTIVNRPY